MIGQYPGEGRIRKRGEKVDMNESPWVLLLVLIGHVVVPSVSAATHPATEVVESLHDTLIAVMKEGKKLGYQGRYDRLAPVIATSYDLPFIARTVVGKYWETFSPEQKSRFVETFRNLSVATYAKHFDAFSGERFRTVSEKDLGNGQILVRTRLVKSNGDEVTLDYLLRQVGNQWRIVNAIADGVSDLALKRSDYTSFLKSKGFDPFIAKLSEKIVESSR
jgi:phospholipid transport system substrate-binding protein